MADKIFISQKQAKKDLCAAGWSGRAAAAEVGNLMKFPDGKRVKVKSVDVWRIIRLASEGSPPAPPIRKPIRPCIPRAQRLAKMNRSGAGETI